MHGWYGALAGAAACVVALASPLRAHGALRSSLPAAGAQLAAAPRTLRLTFTESSPLNVTRVRLVGADSQSVALGPMSHLDGGARRILHVPVVGSLAAGTWAVEWQTAGADGHPVRGRFTFVVQPGAAPPSSSSSDPSSGQSSGPVATSSVSTTTFDASSPIYVTVRYLSYLALLALIGTVVFRLRLLGSARPSVVGSDPRLTDTVRIAGNARALNLAAWATLAIAVLALARLAAQSYAIFGADALDIRLTSGLLLAFPWGTGWLLQVAAVLVAWWSVVRIRAGMSADWWGLVAASIALAVSSALTGHAAATGAAAMIADTAHVLGAGGWIGTLFALFVAGFPAVRADPDGGREAAMASLARAFTPVALISVSVLGVSGLFASWLYLSGPADLWLTPYGRTLSLKLLVLSAVIATGWYNWKRVTPQLSAPAGTRLLRRTIAAELTIAALVLGVTAVLTATPTPREMRAMQEPVRPTSSR